MGKKFDALREQLSGLQRDPDNTDADAILEAVLASKNAYLIAQAARLIADQGRARHLGALIGTFDQFLVRPQKTDPQCKAKTAIAQVLTELGQHESELYEKGAYHVQLEPVWGGKEDTAPNLRAACAIGLAASGDPDAMLVCADLLNDPSHIAREGAARAIGYAGRMDGMPLLRLKANVGDTEPAVLSTCFSALLALDAETNASFVARFLDPEKHEAVQEAAALALGESRLQSALQPLVQWTEGPLEPSLRRVAYVAVALLRSDAGWEWLLDVVENGIFADAEHALHALSAFSHDEGLVERVRDAAGLRLRDLVDALF